jgi:hypothetical protein
MLQQIESDVLPIARSFFSGSYIAEEVADSFWFFNLPGVPFVWAKALLETPQIRPTAAQELSCLGRAFLARSFGGREDAPAWSLNGFELFSYKLVAEVTQLDASRVGDALDLACAFGDCAVVKQASGLKAFIVAAENQPSSAVYYKREARALKDWEIALAEALSLRIAADAEARSHVAVSEPVHVFLQSVGYTVGKSSSPSLILVRELALQNMQSARSTRIAKDAKFQTRWNASKLQLDRLERSCFAPSRGIQKCSRARG